VTTVATSTLRIELSDIRDSIQKNIVENDQSAVTRRDDVLLQVIRALVMSQRLRG